MKDSIVVIFILVLFFSCSNRIPKPDNLISEAKMADIIYDVSILTAAKGVNRKLLEENGILPEQYVFSKHNIDSLQFVSSLNYYASDIETYDEIYTRVEKKINDKKERIKSSDTSNVDTKEETPKRIIKDLLSNNNLSDMMDGYRIRNVKLNIQSADTDFNEKSVLNISRKTITSSSYVEVSNFDIKPNSEITVSIFVKKTIDKSAFGLRISGVYPNRVDAVFNLNDGTLKGVKSNGYIENGEASIKLLKDGWYECKLKAKANTGKVKIVFGPTDINKPIGAWEGKSKTMSNVQSTLPVITIK